MRAVTRILFVASVADGASAASVYAQATLAYRKSSRTHVRRLVLPGVIRVGSSPSPVLIEKTRVAVTTGGTGQYRTHRATAARPVHAHVHPDRHFQPAAGAQGIRVDGRRGPPRSTSTCVCGALRETIA